MLVYHINLGSNTFANNHLTIPTRKLSSNRYLRIAAVLGKLLVELYAVKMC